MRNINRNESLTIDFSAASDPILMKFSLLKSSQREESESDVSFSIAALEKVHFIIVENLYFFNKKTNYKLAIYAKLILLIEY